MAGNDTFTKALLHLETNVVDSNAGGSAKTWTANGDAAIATPATPPPFGTGAVRFQGAGTLTVPDSSDFTISGDFTIDVWVYIDIADPGYIGLINKPNPSGSIGPYLIVQNGAVWYYFGSSDGGGWDIAAFKSFGAADTGVWTHLEVSYTGGTYYLFKNGTLATSFAGAAPANNAHPFVIGHFPFDTYTLDGYVKEFRFSNGVARHTANFTPETSAYSADSGSSGSFAITESPDVAAFSGTSTVSCTIAVTEVPDVAAFAGTSVVSGSFAITEAPDVAAFTGPLPVSGSFAITEALDVAAFVGTSVVSGSFAITEAPDVAAFAGLSFTGVSFAITEPPDVLAFAGLAGTALVLAVTEPQDAAAFVGTLVTSGNISAVEPQDIAEFLCQTTVSVSFSVYEYQDTASFACLSVSPKHIETKIVEGLLYHFSGIPLAQNIRIAYPNEDFIQDGSAFVRLSIEKNDPTTWHLGGGREPLRVGLFMAVVCWPVGQGIIAASELAGLIRDRFAYNTVIDYDGIVLRITEEPRVAGDMQEDVYAEIPVIISWMVTP